MNPVLLALLGGAYLLANAVCMAAYLPQIWHVWQSPDARRQVVLSTWWAWTLGGVTEWLYAGLVAEQTVWTVMAAAHTLACGIVALLGTHARWRSGFRERPTGVIAERA
jgi:hypothetical protein